MKYLFIALCLLSSHSFAQSAQRMIFITEAPLNNDSSAAFTYNRIHEKNNVLKEDGLFGNPVTSTHIFRQVNKDWYYKAGNTWKPFYLHDKHTNPVILSDGENCQLNDKGSDSLVGLPCVLYETSGNRLTVSDRITFWFNPQFGVIRIIANNQALIRKDINNKSL